MPPPPLRFLCAALALAALPAAAQVAPPAAPPPATTTPAPPPATGPRTETALEALWRDAGEYARLYDVPLPQAAGNLAAEIASVPATDALAAEFADRLVGITVERTPGPGIAVHLAGDAPVAPRTIAAGAATLPVTFHTGLAAPMSALVGAITRHQGTIRAALRRPPALGIDPRTGTLVVFAGDADVAAFGADALARRFAGLTGVPVRVAVAGAPADLSVAGGGRVTGASPETGRPALCTAGFAVTDGTRAGLSTAAHCPDTLTLHAPYAAPVTLPFVTQAGWGYQDVQINLAAGDPSPLFLADAARTLARAATGIRPRAATRVGDLVCHRGERSGYSCAEVQMTDFAPAGDLCGGDCLPTWVAVNGPVCRPGDSGGPVFAGGTAIGLVKGGTYRPDGSCVAYYYMSLDYLPAPWRLVTAAPDPAAPLAHWAPTAESGEAM